MLVRYLVTLQGCPSTCIVPLPVYSSVIIRSCSALLRSMPIYQAQLKRTDFRSFAPAAGVYCAPPPPRPAPARPPPPPPAPRPPPPPPARPPPAAGALAGAWALAVDNPQTVRTIPIETRAHAMLRG